MSALPVDRRPPVVTALRARGSTKIEVDLDGRRWRVVPLEAVYAAGLSVGCPLDRAAARALGRALRRHETEAQSLRALRARDHTVASLEQRLADKGAAPAVRREAVEAAQRSGLVDDRRFAQDRSSTLAARGAGNHLIADDLEQHGVSDETIRAVLDLLEPESSRVARLIEQRGPTPRTARHLAARGFSEETLETLVADLAAEAVD